MSDGSDGIEVD